MREYKMGIKFPAKVVRQGPLLALIYYFLVLGGGQGRPVNPSNRQGLF